MGRYAEAVTDYDCVISLDPGNANAHHNRSVSYEKLGQMPPALPSTANSQASHSIQQLASLRQGALHVEAHVAAVVGAQQPRRGQVRHLEGTGVSLGQSMVSGPTQEGAFAHSVGGLAAPLASLFAALPVGEMSSGGRPMGTAPMTALAGSLQGAQYQGGDNRLVKQQAQQQQQKQKQVPYSPTVGAVPNVNPMPLLKPTTQLSRRSSGDGSSGSNSSSSIHASAVVHAGGHDIAKASVLNPDVASASLPAAMQAGKAQPHTLGSVHAGMRGVPCLQAGFFQQR